MTKLDVALDKLKDASPRQQDEVAEAILFLLEDAPAALSDEDVAEIKRRLAFAGQEVEHDKVFAWLAAQRA